MYCFVLPLFNMANIFINLSTQMTLYCYNAMPSMHSLYKRHRSGCTLTPKTFWENRVSYFDFMYLQ